MPAPRLSIGLPVYNGGRFLAAAIDSLLEQDYRDFELVISDNASKDRTPEICAQYAARDPRVRFYRAETNRGAKWNFREVFERSTAKYFKWAAHDDLSRQGFLRRCMEVMENAPDSVVLVAPRTEIVDENGIVTPGHEIETIDTRAAQPHQRLAEVLRKVKWATCQFGVLRADALRKTRLIDSFYASDNVLLAELAMLGEIWEIPEVLFQRRFYSGVSTEAHSPSALKAWFDPSRKKSRTFLSPKMYLGIEFLRSIRRMPLSAPQRWKCYYTALSVWYGRQFCRVGTEYKARLDRRMKALVLEEPRQT